MVPAFPSALPATFYSTDQRAVLHICLVADHRFLCCASEDRSCALAGGAGMAWVHAATPIGIKRRKRRRKKKKKKKKRDGNSAHNGTRYRTQITRLSRWVAPACVRGGTRGPHACLGARRWRFRASASALPRCCARLADAHARQNRRRR